MEEISDTIVPSEDDIEGDEQPNGNDDITSDEEDPQMPTAMELDEASVKRKQKDVLIIDIEEGNIVGEPVINQTDDDENHELNRSVKHLENEDRKANIVQTTSKSTAETQDDPEVVRAEPQTSAQKNTLKALRKITKTQKIPSRNK